MTDPSTTERLLRDAVDSTDAPPSLIAGVRARVVRRRRIRRLAAGAGVATLVGVAAVALSTLGPSITPQVDSAGSVPDVAVPDDVAGPNIPAAPSDAISPDVAGIELDVVALEQAVASNDIGAAELPNIVYGMLEGIESTREQLSDPSAAELVLLDDLVARVQRLATSDGDVTIAAGWQLLPGGPVHDPFAAAVLPGGSVLAVGVDSDGAPAAAVLDAEGWTSVPTPNSVDWDEVMDGRVSVEAVTAGDDVLVVVAGPELSVLRYVSSSQRWSRASSAPISGRAGAAVVWAEDRLLVWGGYDVDPRKVLGDGATWNPTTGQWRRMASAPLSPRGEPTAVWDGARVHLLLGGTHDGANPEDPSMWPVRLTDGASYDPSTDTWGDRIEFGIDGPAAAAVWTGSDVVVWNGTSDGGAATVVWEPTSGALVTGAGPGANTPTRRRDGPTPSGWDADRRQLVVWGGVCGEGCLSAHADGVVYDPFGGGWTQIANAPGATLGPEAPRLVGVWTGTRMVVLQVGGDAAAWTP